MTLVTAVLQGEIFAETRDGKKDWGASGIHARGAAFDQHKSEEQHVFFSDTLYPDYGRTPAHHNRYAC